MYAVGVATRGRNKTSEGNVRSKHREEEEEEEEKEARKRKRLTTTRPRKKMGEGARVAGKRKQEEGDKIGIKGREKRRSPRTSEMSYPSVSGALPSGGNRFRTRARR